MRLYRVYLPQREIAADLPLTTHGHSAHLPGSMNATSEASAPIVVAIRDCYLAQGLSVAEIAQKLGLKVSLIRRQMVQSGIPPRSRSEAMRIKRARDDSRLVKLPIDEVSRLYAIDGLTLAAIASRFRCSPGTVRNSLRRAGVARAPSGRRRVKLSKAQLEALYLGEGLSLREIAKRLHCDHSTIKNKLAQYGIASRTYAEANTNYPCRDFDGDQCQKAYLLGFRQGDLYATTLGASGQTIVVECSTTKQEQIDLFFSLFELYGHVHIGKPKRDGNRGMACYLNRSFDFLLPKADFVPAWVQTDPTAAVGFAAGYIDAEGSFFVSGGTAQFAVSAYDGNIIHWLHKWMTEAGVVCPAPRLVGLEGSVRPNGAVFRKDLWSLSVARKASLVKLIELLAPYLKHAKRQADMRRAQANIEARNARRSTVKAVG